LRYFAELSYLGKNYHGWQIQPDAISIQEVVQKALSIILRTQTEVVAAGRTDAGVHATQMFIYFDTDQELDSKIYSYKINALLPHDIVFHRLFKVNPEAHTRFHATKRSYEYHVFLGRTPFALDTKWQIQRHLDVAAMNKSAQVLLEHTNFKCFSKSKTDVKTYNCNITRAEWIQDGQELVFHISADRFLRNMVRAIVGTLYNVGLGKIKPEDITSIIESQNRSNAGTSAPAHGLFLTEITYPETIIDGI